MPKLIKYISISALILLIGFLNANQDLNEKLDRLLDNQKVILTRLQKLEKNQNELAKKINSNPGSNKKNNRPQVDYNKEYKVPVGESVVLGNPTADVTIIKWTDFQWPYCAKSTGLVDDILKKYPNDVRVVVKNFPLGSHKQANKAALYALAAGRQGKYKEMFNKIFDNWRQLRNNEDLPLSYADELGLNIDQIKSDIKDPSLQKIIDDEMNQLKGTGMRMAVPKFLINGKEPQGRDLASWSKIIDGYLKK